MAEAPIKRKRLENLDVLKGIAIIAVVVGHLAAKGSEYDIFLSGPGYVQYIS